MDLTAKKATKAKRRVLAEEDTNRDGRWTRSFTVRQEIWHLIEQWATEHHFHLVAMKSRRRGYQQGRNPSWYTVHLDIKQVENEFTITAWIQVGLSARLATLFRHPREFLIEPTGWLGSVVRRRACRDFNELLDRLKQPAIANSLGFHIADLDPSSRWLAALLIFPVVFFLVGTVRGIDPDPRLTVELLKAIGKPLGILLGVGLALLSLHNFVFAKKFPRLLWRNASAGVNFVLFSILSVWLFSRASHEMTRYAFLHHCIGKPSDPRCSLMKQKFSEKDRHWLLERVKEVEKELSVRPREGQRTNE